MKRISTNFKSIMTSFNFFTMKLRYCKDGQLQCNTCLPLLPTEKEGKQMETLHANFCHEYLKSSNAGRFCYAHTNTGIQKYTKFCNQ